MPPPPTDTEAAPLPCRTGLPSRAQAPGRDPGPEAGLRGLQGQWEGLQLNTPGGSCPLPHGGGCASGKGRAQGQCLSSDTDRPPVRALPAVLRPRSARWPSPLSHLKGRHQGGGGGGRPGQPPRVPSTPRFLRAPPPQGDRGCLPVAQRQEARSRQWGQAVWWDPRDPRNGSTVQEPGAEAEGTPAGPPARSWGTEG